MNEDKQVLTIEKLKERNDSAKALTKIVVPVLLVLVIIGVVSLINAIKAGEGLMSFAIPAVFIIIPLFIIGFFKKNVKGEANQNNIIDNRDFKIVEDVIYDRQHKTKLKNGDKKHYYYIFTKIYGKIKVHQHVYESAQKDDLVYILFYSGKELDNGSNINSSKEERERNERNIDQVYLASQYTISPELYNYIVSYDNELAENNYIKRFNRRVNKLRKQTAIVNCKKCGNKYNPQNNELCPSCGTSYEFSAKEIMKENGWY